jgi:hypothetical protein
MLHTDLNEQTIPQNYYNFSIYYERREKNIFGKTYCAFILFK